MWGERKTCHPSSWQSCSGRECNGWHKWVQWKNQQVSYISISVQQLSSSLVSHLYGVFPTHGYSNDSRYPQSYQVGEVVLDNAGCSLKNKVGPTNINVKTLPGQLFSAFLHSWIIWQRSTNKTEPVMQQQISKENCVSAPPEYSRQQQQHRRHATIHTFIPLCVPSDNSLYSCARQVCSDGW